MNLYRIYISQKGIYKRIGKDYNADKMLKSVENIINSKYPETILVIEHDIEMDCDKPIFLYYGYNMPFNDSLDALKEQLKPKVRKRVR